MTKGPTLLLVGDNPGGVERVTVEPISGRGKTFVDPGGNLVAMAGGGTFTAFGGYAERRSYEGSIIDTMRWLRLSAASRPRCSACQILT